MQFDLIFSTTKYVIPLIGLISTGQVFNGLWSSMITAQALGSGKKSSPGSGSARGGASIPKAPHRSTPKSAALAGLDDTAANSPRASPPVAGAGAVAVEDVEVAMEGMALEAPASQDPKQRVLSQVNLAELPGTAGAGAEEARQILAGAPHTVPPEPCP